MPQRVVYMLFLFFALFATVSCTNDETDEGLEVITPNDPAETGTSRTNAQGNLTLKQAERKAAQAGTTKS